MVKASGLCAGKGVIMAQTQQEAIEAFDEMQKGCFGSAGQQVARGLASAAPASTVPYL